jgi:mannosyl-oligosaccharide alpha-1,2-mannosidase
LNQNNDLPFGHIDFSDNTPEIAVVCFSSCSFISNRPDLIPKTNIAEAGTLSLEWFTLSKFTGNATYSDLTAKSVEHIANLVRYVHLKLAVADISSKAAPLPG